MLQLRPLQQCEVLHQEKTVFALESNLEKLQLGVAVDYQNLLSLEDLQLFAVELACRVFNANSKHLFLVSFRDSVYFAVQWLLVECVIIVNPSLRRREVQTFILKVDKLGCWSLLDCNLVIISFLCCVRVVGRISLAFRLFLPCLIFYQQLPQLRFYLNFLVG